jgi:hypothetical protein
MAVSEPLCVVNVLQVEQCAKRQSSRGGGDCHRPRGSTRLTPIRGTEEDVRHGNQRHDRQLEDVCTRAFVGLVAIAQRMNLPLVATGAVRFARPTVLGHTGRDGYDLPTITVEAVRAQAYLKSPQQMWRAFGQLPAALDASIEIAERCDFRLPLARKVSSGNGQQYLGPELLFGQHPHGKSLTPSSLVIRNQNGPW